MTHDGRKMGMLKDFDFYRNYALISKSGTTNTLGFMTEVDITEKRDGFKRAAATKRKENGL